MAGGVKKNMQRHDDRKTAYQPVNDISGLREVVRELQNETKIAVDLEADSMYHFKEKVCLIQLATKAKTYIVDPLEVQDMSALKPVFADRAIKKIFHGADYDIRSLYRDFRIEIHHLFDTQLASMFLGEKETSLEAVLHKRFGVELNKRYQRKDWSVRPLRQAMFDYAAEDVRYLIPLTDVLIKELKGKNRLSWVEEECEYLSRVRPTANNDEPLFLHFKGAGRLDRRSLAVLEALLRYRRTIARKKDKPLFKILSNRILMGLAKTKPVNSSHLQKRGLLSQKQIQMYGVGLLEAIQRALHLTENRLPVYPRKKAPVLARGVPARIKKIKTWRDETAHSYHIDPGLLFNKALMQAVAVHRPTSQKDFDGIPGMKRWQCRAFGRELIKLLKNEKEA